ncbi:MAG: hypothetical protein KJO76_11340 [Gammaproteobacteria bacterium]|nr:hypothetical protein [Gammaproteobacteria bacterium]NND37628.1 hypothetical protein [Gammaproteobacteria bacterium]
MRKLVTILLMCLLIPLTAWGWEPDPNDKQQVKAAAALEEYQKSDKIRARIDEAYGYAILPFFFRAAAGLGGAYGNGLVIEQNALVGEVWTIQGMIGFAFGGEFHSQIILFRNRETLELFKRGRFEFQGRANAAALVWGAGADPGFVPAVAIYTRTKFGAMIEVDAILSKYNYKSIQTD